jgi:hypothetical protein
LFKFQKNSNSEYVQILELFKFENSSIPKICSNLKNEKRMKMKNKIENKNWKLMKTGPVTQKPA